MLPHGRRVGSGETETWQVTEKVPADKILLCAAATEAAAHNRPGGKF